jgi:hypothetical protein
MSAPDRSRELDVLAALSHRTNLPVGCYCEEESRCHRFVLRELLAERGADVVQKGRRFGWRQTCDNTLGMSDAAKAISTVLLSILALGFATFAGYSLSILRAGNWAYPELVAPICGQMVAAIFALVGIAFVNRRHRGTGAIFRLAALLAVGCFTAAGGVFVGLMSNYSLSCGNKIVAQLPSPNGRWKAVVFSRFCVAIARVLPGGFACVRIGGKRRVVRQRRKCI